MSLKKVRSFCEIFTVLLTLLAKVQGVFLLSFTHKRMVSFYVFFDDCFLESPQPHTSVLSKYCTVNHLDHLYHPMFKFYSAFSGGEKNCRKANTISHQATTFCGCSSDCLRVVKSTAPIFHTAQLI